MAEFSFHEVKEDFMRDMDIHIPMDRDLVRFMGSNLSASNPQSERSAVGRMCSAGPHRLSAFSESLWEVMTTY
jgi:hypothetical protein